MNTKKIFNDKGESFMRIFSTDVVENVNPVDYYKTYEVKKRAILLRDLLSAKDPFLASIIDDDIFLKAAEESIGTFFDKYEKAEVHKNFLTLLEKTRKQEQVQLLKGMTLNPTQLMSLIFKSYNDFGFRYSKYLFENLPSGIEEKKLPKFFHLKEDNTIEKAGETDLSEGELKNVIEQRKVIVAHFFEKGELWHCFFLTYNSIAGKENHNNGQPHFHYISSGFGISKNDFIKSMRTGKYKSTSIHFDLLEYGNQPEE